MRRYRTWLADSGRWDGFEFRPDDIVISTPAKCGTTWLQMICALLVFRDARLPGPLTELSPWLDIRTRDVPTVFAALAAQRHRRFIKTHTPLDGLPFDERVTYLCMGRDPRDAAISAGHHLDSMNRAALLAARARVDGTARARGDDTGPPSPDPAGPLSPDPAGPPAADPGRAGVEDPVERFWRWVEHDAPPDEGLELLLHHLATFWARRRTANVVLVHHADLRADLAGGMRRLADRLGITVDEDAWPGLVAEAGFDRMRERAGALAPQVTTDGLWPDPRRFFHRGTGGQWRGFLNAGDLDRYRARVRRLGPPAALASWVHRG